jgi:hypothetical protein
MGFSPSHATSIPIALYPETGYITAQFHVVFDNWFATVAASIEDLHNFNSTSAWAKMFCDSSHQYILDDEDKDEEQLIIEEADKMEQARHKEKVLQMPLIRQYHRNLFPSIHCQ